MSIVMVRKYYILQGESSADSFCSVSSLTFLHSLPLCACHLIVCKHSTHIFQRLANVRKCSLQSQTQPSRWSINSICFVLVYLLSDHSLPYRLTVSTSGCSTNSSGMSPGGSVTCDALSPPRVQIRSPPDPVMSSLCTPPVPHAPRRAAHHVTPPV